MDTPRLFISPHVPERWAERIQPGICHAHAKAACRRFLEAASILDEPPRWLSARTRAKTWYVECPSLWPDVVGIGIGTTLKTVVARRRPGDAGTVAATIRFVGFEGVAPGADWSEAA